MGDFSVLDRFFFTYMKIFPSSFPSSLFLPGPYQLQENQTIHQNMPVPCKGLSIFAKKWNPGDALKYHLETVKGGV